MSTWQRLTGDWTNTLVASFVFLFTLAIYTVTMHPSVPFWDAGEYIATSYILGVPHAPGTPLYVLLGKMFTFIPFGTIAQRVNWFSAVSSAVAVLFIYLLGVKATRRTFPVGTDSLHRPLAYVAGVVAAFMAAFATTFWDNAIEAEVYAASCALMAFAVWLVFRWQEQLDKGNEDGILLLITYLVGLGIGIHLGVAVAAWAAVIFVFLNRPQYLYRWEYVGWALVTLSLATGIHKFAMMVAPAVLLITLALWIITGRNHRLPMWAAVLFMLGVSVHFFLIIRSNLDPIINEAAPKTWDALWKMLIRDQYKPPNPWDRRVPGMEGFAYQMDFMWLRYMWWNFSLLGEKVGNGYGVQDFLRGLLHPTILLAIGGAAMQFLRDRKGALLCLVLFVLLGPALAFYLNFRGPIPVVNALAEVRERDYFFVQNFMFLAIWVGVGAAALTDWIRRQVKGGAQKPVLAGVGLALVGMSLLPMFQNWEEHDRRGFYVARDYAYNMLNGLEQDAIIFTNGDNDTFPLWYLQEVEGVRKDVRVVNLSLLNTDWYMHQLRDLEPKVPLTWTDDQIQQLPLAAYRQNQKDASEGKRPSWYVKDFGVLHIVRENNFQRPIYFAVTIPNSDKSIEMHKDRLVMEGLVYRLEKEPVDRDMDVDKTLYNLENVYKYGGLLKQNPDGTWGEHDDSVYKDDNSRKLVQNVSTAFVKVALGLLERGDAEAALEQVDRAEDISPNFPGISIAKGLILEDLGRVDEAVAHYMEMMELFPYDWQIPYRLGELYVDQGQISSAVPHFARALELAPTDQFFPYQALASCYYQLGQYEPAADVLQRWLILHPDDRNIRPFYEELRRSLIEGRTPGPVDQQGTPAPPDTQSSAPPPENER